MARRVTLRYIAITASVISLVYLFHCRYNPVEDTFIISGNEKLSSLMAATDCEVFHLITMFFNGYAWQGFENFTLRDLNEREKEYLHALQRNLNHSCIKKIHLFYYNPADLETLETSNLTNRHKLVLIRHTQLLHMSDFYVYASKNLVNRAVIAANSDIILGEGLQLIDIDRMRTEKQLFSLSRHEMKCNTTSHPLPVPCSKEGYKTLASHDTHIFRLSSPLNETLLQKLDYPINMKFAANGLISEMRRTFKFEVLNPCETVKTYHRHCSPVVASKGPAYSLLSLGWKRSEIERYGLATPTNLEKLSH